MQGQTASFCSFDPDTIYISAEEFSREILGHEITHALLNHYFVVSPPQKVAEILSLHVEYQLHQSKQGL